VVSVIHAFIRTDVIVTSKEILRISRQSLKQVIFILRSQAKPKVGNVVFPEK